MNKSILYLAAAVVFAAFAFAPSLPAAEKKASGPAAGPETKMEKKAEAKAKVKVRSATGEVVSVDPKAGALTVKGKGKETSFSAESKTAKAALEKVKSGDRVTVSYTEQDGKMVARSVKQARPLKTTAKAEAKKEKM